MTFFLPLCERFYPLPLTATCNQRYLQSSLVRYFAEVQLTQHSVLYRGTMCHMLAHEIELFLLWHPRQISCERAPDQVYQTVDGCYYEPSKVLQPCKRRWRKKRKSKPSGAHPLHSQMSRQCWWPKTLCERGPRHFIGPSSWQAHGMPFWRLVVFT